MKASERGEKESDEKGQLAYEGQYSLVKDVDIGKCLGIGETVKAAAGWPLSLFGLAFCLSVVSTISYSE